jgi:DNA polymerase III epsilon subunit-like protein
MIDLNQTAQTIEQLLEQEQNATITSRDDLAVIAARRTQIWAHIHELEHVTTDYVSRVRALAELPDIGIMDWAEAVLAMKNRAILVLDTTSLDGDIIRIHARMQDTLFDFVVRPERELTANTAYTGINWDEIKDAMTLAEAWPMIHDYLSGSFIVGYNLPWIEERLKDNVSYYDLKRLPFRGDCLQKYAKSYFHYSGFGSISLSNAVARIGKPFPYHPPTADMRATGILHLLLAMSQGVMSGPKIDVNSSLGDLDDHPF